MSEKQDHNFQSDLRQLKKLDDKLSDIDSIQKLSPIDADSVKRILKLCKIMQDHVARLGIDE